LQKRYYLDIIEVPHLKEEYSNEKTTESWAGLDEEQISKSEIEKPPVEHSKGTLLTNNLMAFQ